MDRDFWVARWRNGETGWHLPHPNPLLVEHWPALEVPKGTEVFVPLCGKSEDMVWLAQQGYRVLGNELCEAAVAAFFAEQGLTPMREALGEALVRWQAGPYTLIEGDFFQLSPAWTAQVSAVYDRAALVAFPPAMRPRYAEQLQRLAPKGAGYLLISLTGPVSPEMGPPFSVPEAEIGRLFGDMERLLKQAVKQVERKGQAWTEMVWTGVF